MDRKESDSMVEVVQRDWENREFIETIQQSILQIVTFLNQFDISTRYRLAQVQSKLTRLERHLDYLEASISQSDPRTREAEKPKVVASATPAAAPQHYEDEGSANSVPSTPSVVAAAGEDAGSGPPPSPLPASAPGPPPAPGGAGGGPPRTPSPNSDRRMRPPPLAVPSGAPPPVPTAAITSAAPPPPVPAGASQGSPPPVPSGGPTPYTPNGPSSHLNGGPPPPRLNGGAVPVPAGPVPVPAGPVPVPGQQPPQPPEDRRSPSHATDGGEMDSYDVDVDMDSSAPVTPRAGSHSGDKKKKKKKHRHRRMKLGPNKDISLKVLKEGDGKTKPHAASVVLVDYTGYLSDGSKFDTSVDYTIALGTRTVVEGLEIVLQEMTLGSRASFKIPAYLAYGSSGAPGVIPPDCDLKFDLELKDIQA